MSGVARAAVIVPARNEVETIGSVVAGLRSAGAGRIVVVDNGSTDGTAGAAIEGGADVIVAPRTGYGWSCLAGVRATADFEIVAFIDGDGSFDPADLAGLVELVASGEADLALGARTRSSMPAHQRAGNRLTLALLRSWYGISVGDVAPLRAVRRDLLGALDMQGTRYGWLVEMLAKAARCGLRIAVRRVSYGPRVAGTSKVSGSMKGSMLAGSDFLRALIAYRAWSPDSSLRRDTSS
ncbi:MAG: glycosyltransferase family 2 protein [Candidatus Limnocylindria bacterium]